LSQLLYDDQLRFFVFPYLFKALSFEPGSMPGSGAGLEF
jgi:hypothetical protein